MKFPRAVEWNDAVAEVNFLRDWRKCFAAGAGCFGADAKCRHGEQSSREAGKKTATTGAVCHLGTSKKREALLAL